MVSALAGVLGAGDASAQPAPPTASGPDASAPEGTVTIWFVHLGRPVPHALMQVQVMGSGGGVFGVRTGSGGFARIRGVSPDRFRGVSVGVGTTPSTFAALERGHGQAIVVSPPAGMSVASFVALPPEPATSAGGAAPPERDGLDPSQPAGTLTVWVVDANGPRPNADVNATLQYTDGRTHTQRLKTTPNGSVRMVGVPVDFVRGVVLEAAGTAVTALPVGRAQGSVAVLRTPGALAPREFVLEVGQFDEGPVSPMAPPTTAVQPLAQAAPVTGAPDASSPAGVEGNAEPSGMDPTTGTHVAFRLGLLATGGGESTWTCSGDCGGDDEISGDYDDGSTVVFGIDLLHAVTPGFRLGAGLSLLPGSDVEGEGGGGDSAKLGSEIDLSGIAEGVFRVADRSALVLRGHVGLRLLFGSEDLEDARDAAEDACTGTDDCDTLGSPYAGITYGIGGGFIQSFEGFGLRFDLLLSGYSITIFEQTLSEDGLTAELSNSLSGSRLWITGGVEI